MNSNGNTNHSGYSNCHIRRHHTSLSVDLLGEPSASITFQLLHIHPALQEADETDKNNCIWEKGGGKTFTTPGRFTELIDPDINVAKGYPHNWGHDLWTYHCCRWSPKLPQFHDQPTSRVRTVMSYWYRGAQADSAFFVKTEQLNTRLPELGVAHIAHRRSNLVREFRIFSTIMQLTSSSTPQSKRRISPVVSAFTQLPNAHARTPSSLLHVLNTPRHKNCLTENDAISR
ncbi:hypothetical protein B0H14DRAFT_2583271 [Mycena olivaceomarginata]|nr:hypothetical protein B0H14DRAFT_2583271 [Mycena olivaceomarginata]